MMEVSIRISGDDLSPLEQAVLAALAGATEKPVEVKAETSPPPVKKTAAKKAATKTAETVAPEPDDTAMETAVARATALINDGKADQLRSTLADLGVKRVSELKDEALATFLEKTDDAA